MLFLIAADAHDRKYGDLSLAEKKRKQDQLILVKNELLKIAYLVLYVHFNEH